MTTNAQIHFFAASPNMAVVLVVTTLVADRGAAFPFFTIRQIHRWPAFAESEHVHWGFGRVCVGRDNIAQVTFLNLSGRFFGRTVGVPVMCSAEIGCCCHIVNSLCLAKLYRDQQGIWQSAVDFVVRGVAMARPEASERGPATILSF
jgi:hypothetical protein